MFKWQSRMILMIKSKWVLLSSIKTNKSFTQMSVRMIGSLNVRELLINLKFNQKPITKNGGLELSPPELQLTLWRKSKQLYNVASQMLDQFWKNWTMSSPQLWIKYQNPKEWSTQAWVISEINTRANLNNWRSCLLTSTI